MGTWIGAALLAASIIGFIAGMPRRGEVVVKSDRAQMLLMMLLILGFFAGGALVLSGLN